MTGAEVGAQSSGSRSSLGRHVTVRAELGKDCNDESVLLRKDNAGEVAQG